MTAIQPILPTGAGFQPEASEVSLRAQGTRKVAQQALGQLNATWPYVSKSTLMFRHILNIAANMCRYVSCNCDRLAARVSVLVLKLKLLSAVSVPLNVQPTRASFQRLQMEWRLQDWEGVTQSLVSLGLLAADSLDSLITFVDSTLKLTGETSVKWMSAISLPLALGLLSGAIASRGYKVYLAFRLKGEVGLQLELLLKDSEGNLEELKEFLEKSLGPTREQCQKLADQARHLDPKTAESWLSEEMSRFKELRASILKRHGSPEVAEAVNRLYNLLRTTSPSPERLKKVICALEALQNSLRGKMVEHFVAIASSALTLVGIGLFFASVPPFVPFVVLGAATAIKLGSMVYEDFGGFADAPAPCF